MLSTLSMEIPSSPSILCYLDDCSQHLQKLQQQVEEEMQQYHQYDIQQHVSMMNDFVPSPRSWRIKKNCISNSSLNLILLLFRLTINRLLTTLSNN